jgi:peptidyl-Asp metalloendopeptidase
MNTLGTILVVLTGFALSAMPVAADGTTVSFDMGAAASKNQGMSVLKPVTAGMDVVSPGTALGQKLALAPSRAAGAATALLGPRDAKRAQIVIDVMVAYTPKAASHYNEIEREVVYLAIEEANHSFRLSGIGHIRLRLAHTFQIDYVEDGGHFDHVWRLADKDDGYMGDIHGLREAYAADVTILIVDDAKGCGLATRIGADNDEAFAVVHHACAEANYTVAHEIGHLMGARHELSYVNASKWRDIMAYKQSCNGCPRLPVWSNPLVLIGGEPAGTEELNNARVIAENAWRVASFR